MLDIGLRRWWRRMGFDQIETRSKRFTYELEHVGQDLQAKVLADTVTFVEDAGRHVREAKAATDLEFRALWAAWFLTPAPITLRRAFYQVLIALSASVGGWAFVILEGLLATAFSLEFLRASTQIALAIGIVTTVVIALAVKGLVAPLLLASYEQMPRAGLRRLLVAAGTMFVTEMFLIGVLFLARSVSTDVTDMAFRVAAAIISITTPLTAAVLFALATLLGWSDTLVTKWERLSHLERQITAQVNLCLARLATIATQAPTHAVTQTMSGRANT